MSGNKYFFISDIHLGINGKEFTKLQEKILVDFLNDIRNEASELFIVGDLFDCWIEYKQVVPKGFYRFFSALADLTENNVRVNYLSGNHDFWRGKYFFEEFGIDIIYDNISREIDGKKFFISHGDGLAYKDTGYKILKKILRNRVAQKLYSWLHPDFGIWLAKRSSSTSRVHTNNKDYSQRDGLRDFAVKKIDEGYDYAVMGHRHNAKVEKHNSGYYINLGDWIRNFNYGVYEKGNFRLMQYYDWEKGLKVNLDLTEKLENEKK